MATMKDIIQSPLLLALVIGGLLYISAFSLVYLKRAYDHCLELGITRKELSNVIKSSLIFSVVPSTCAMELEIMVSYESEPMTDSRHQAHTLPSTAMSTNRPTTMERLGTTEKIS